MARSASATEPVDVLARIDATIAALDQMRDELRRIREWAEVMQRASRGVEDG